jgi:hypothetical protein
MTRMYRTNKVVLYIYEPSLDLYSVVLHKLATNDVLGRKMFNPAYPNMRIHAV